MMITESNRKIGECPAAAHAASVNDTPAGETHDSDSELEDDTTGPKRKGHEENSHNADNNLSFDEVLDDDPEDELEPCVDYIQRATP